MQYWRIPSTHPGRFIGEYDRQEGVDRFAFKQGKPLASLPASPPTFRVDVAVHELRAIHDVANNAMVPLVSLIVTRILLEVCPSDVQIIPAILICRDGNLHDYSIVVITRRIQGLDHQRSLYQCLPGTKAIMRFEKAVYRDDCLGSYHLAREAEYPSHLLVSERLRSALIDYVELDDLNP